MFTTEMWDLICAMQQYDPQEQAEAFGKALFSVCHTSKRLCLIIVWTGQRNYPHPFYIPADDKENHTIDKSMILICESYFYMLNGIYSTRMFLGHVFLSQRRVLYLQTHS